MKTAANNKFVFFMIELFHYKAKETYIFLLTTFSREITIVVDERAFLLSRLDFHNYANGSERYPDEQRKDS